MSLKQQNWLSRSVKSETIFDWIPAYLHCREFIFCWDSSPVDAVIPCNVLVQSMWRFYVDKKFLSKSNVKIKCLKSYFDSRISPWNLFYCIWWNLRNKTGRNMLGRNLFIFTYQSIFINLNTYLSTRSGCNHR